MTKKCPRVSIIIPVFNGERSIAACLDSLMNLDYPNEAYEIIVVENGSTDRTCEILEKYPVRILHSPERGPAAARNLGLKNSQGEIVAFTDADCVAHPQWLRHLVVPYEDPCVGGVGGTILAYQHGYRNIVEQFSDDHAPLINFYSGENEYLPHLYTANASYRLEHLVKVGGFNPHLFTAEDVDISWRIQLETDAMLCSAPEALIYHHHRSTLKGLARQYRHYGFGEIILDTIYRDQQGYPRNLRFHLRRIISQVFLLPKYLISLLIRQIKRLLGKQTVYDSYSPFFWLLIESNSILGKLEGLAATRMMTRFIPVLKSKQNMIINRLYGE